METLYTSTKLCKKILLLEKNQTAGKRYYTTACGKNHHLAFELLPFNDMDYVMNDDDYEKKTMEDPPERLTSKGAFVDVVKDDRACSC